jgi:endo-beta-N-acetylglucosaminidase D
VVLLHKCEQLYASVGELSSWAGKQSDLARACGNELDAGQAAAKSPIRTVLLPESSAAWSPENARTTVLFRGSVGLKDSNKAHCTEYTDKTQSPASAILKWSVG